MLLFLKDKKRQEIESRVEQEKQAFRDEMIVKRKELFSQRRADRQKLRELQRQIEVTSMVRKSLNPHVKI